MPAIYLVANVAVAIKRIIDCLEGSSEFRNDNLLAANRVYLLALSPMLTAASYTARFTLTFKASALVGGFVSVALSLGLPPVAVSNCPSLMLPGLSSHKS